MTERNDPHELAIAHGGLFVGLRYLITEYEDIARTIWGEQGFMQVLGGVTLSRNTAGETFGGEVAIAYGTIGERTMCDVHFFRSESGVGSVVERIVGTRAIAKMVITTPLQPLSFPIEHRPDGVLSLVETEELTAKLEQHTLYNQDETSIAARVLQKYGVYTQYSLEDIASRVYKELGDNPAV